MTKKTISLRPATLRDADLLLAWRNDPETRAASHNTESVGTDEHLAWLESSLLDDRRSLFIAEEDGSPVGTVRADFVAGEYELSWSVAPNARGRGVAKRMVSLLARQIPSAIRAEVKATNKASVRIAEFAGLKFAEQAGGVLVFRRDAVDCRPIVPIGQPPSKPRTN